MILETLFSVALFISGGHLVSTNFKLHHYSDDDYKDIFYLKHNKSISKHCEKHSELEHIQKKTIYHNEGSFTIYKVTKNEGKDTSQRTLEDDKTS